MMQRRAVSLLAATTFLLLFVRADAQPGDQSVLSRQNDDFAQTRAQREESLKILREAAAGVRATDPVKAAHFLNRAGNLNLRLNSATDALEDFRNALAILDNSPDPTTRLETLNGMAAVYGHLTKCQDATLFINRALSLSEQHGLIAGQAEALLILSDCQNQKDHRLAALTAEQSLGLWRSIDDKRGLARAYDILSEVELTQNNLVQASQSSEAALQIWRELNVIDKQAGALKSLGFIECRTGAWQNCISLLLEAQKLINEDDEPYLLGQIDVGIAEAFIESGLPEFGLRKAKESLEFFHRAEDPRGIAAATWDIGKAYYALGNYQDAFNALYDAKEKAEAIDDPLIEAFCHDFLGRTYFAVGNREGALTEFKASVIQFESVGNARGAARAGALIGSLYEQQGKFEAAGHLFSKSLVVFERIGDRVNESAALYAIGALELKQNNLEVAEDFLRRSLHATEDTNNVSTSSDLTAALSSTVYERYQSYIDCLMRRTGTQPDNYLGNDAFEASELAHGRSLAEMLKATETSLLLTLDPDLAEKEKSLRQQLRVKEDSKIRLLAGEYKKDELNQLEQELTQLGQEYKQIRETIKEKFPTFEQLRQPVAWDVKRIQQQVIADDQTLLLEYSLGSERSYAWAVTRDGFQSYELPSEQQVNGAAQRVYQLLQSSDANTSELDQATGALAKMVLSPLAENLNKHRVIVVADGSLNYIPFQILPVAPNDSAPLIAKFEVVNAPSASVLGQLRQENERRRQPSNLLVAFGDAAFPADFAQRKDFPNDQMDSAEALNVDRWRTALRDIELNGDKFDPSSLQRLVYAQRELNSLRELASTGSFIATGFDATKAKLQSTDLSKYAILHFATHGILDPKRPENSGLFLSMVDRDGKDQNGFVGLQDIYNLRAPVDLVVLSACRTGLGKDVRGEGLIGLTRGFMYAGASSVVASLWKVDDEVTSELMRQFYINMLDKQMTPAAALRDAQNTIRQRPEWHSPYYWAAFTIQGEYNKVIMPRKSARFAYVEIIIAVLATTGVAWLFYRRRSRSLSTISH